MSSKLDMALGDIVKSNQSKRPKNKKGGGRGRGRKNTRGGGRGGGRGSGRRGGYGGSRQGRTSYRQSPYLKITEDKDLKITEDKDFKITVVALTILIVLKYLSPI